MNHVLEAIDGQGFGLRASFHWHRDRFAHTVAAVAPDRVLPLLASHEGTSDEVWPSSPPLQDLNVEARSGGHRLILLVGMAGTSHWSASVEADSPDRLIRFDVACRIKERPEVSGSAYRSMVPAQPQSDATASLALSGFHCLVSIHPATASSDDGAVTITPEGVAIYPPSDEDPPPKTLRWKYSIRLL